MKSKFKNLLSLVLVGTLLFTTTITASADTPESTESNQTEYIDQMEPFVYVDENQHFALDVDGAINSGIDVDIVKAQEEVFELLNSASDNQELAINDDLSIDLNQPKLRTVFGHKYYCQGGTTTDFVLYWWGAGRYLCDCMTKDMASAYGNYAANGANVAAFIFPGLGLPAIFANIYFSNIADNMNKNNYGRGVYMTMNWVGYYTVSPR